MRLWVEDLKFHLARALRVVGIGLVAVAWVSVIGSEAQQSADTRAYAQVIAAVLAVLVTQWFTRLPPSARGVVSRARPPGGRRLDRRSVSPGSPQA
jgi:hypothetical protein